VKAEGVVLELYNTRTRRRERVESRDEKEGFGNVAPPHSLTIYACGITPYDEPHLGHGATAIRCAVLRRFLVAEGYRVRFVQNITDIDDKIVNRAKMLGEEPLALACRFTESYREEVACLGVPAPDEEPRVSNYIGTIIAYIQRLLANGNGYVAPSGDVYFDIASALSYGILSGHATGELVAGTRERVRKEKRHALDFALWKRVDDPSESFDSPWGRGRPGWHTECCAMSNALLGATIDIHCGGLDLLFPHHENELVQAECHNHAPFVRHWFHLGLVMLDGIKMSKSEGNVITIADARRRWGVPLLVYGLLTFHYRSPVNIRDELFEERINHLLDLYWFCEMVERLGVHAPEKAGEEDDLSGHPAYLREQFAHAMRSDLNTPQALVAIEQAVFAGLSLLKHSEENRREIAALGSELRRVGEVLGLFPVGYNYERVYQEVVRFIKMRRLATGGTFAEVSLSELEQALYDRDTARNAKDFSRADEIRGRLAEGGIRCEDGTVRQWRIAMSRIS
jgi:cysteinyl-tRNA synthetase